MEAISLQYTTKIKELLGKFLEKDYLIKNDVYLNRLLTHLSGKDNIGFENSLLNSKIISEWICEAIEYWNTNKITPPINISSFTLNLASLLSKNERKFIELNRNNFYIKLVNILKARHENISPTIKLSYIKLLTAFLEHHSGIEWLIATNFWEDVLIFSLINQTIYITKEGHLFLSKLLEKTIDIDETFSNNILKKILLPLNENNLKQITNTNILEISDEIIHKNLSPTLQLIGNILEYYLESKMFELNDFRIIFIMFKNFYLEQYINNYMLIAQNQFLIFDLGKIMFIIQFLELYINIIMKNYQETDINNTIKNIVNVFHTNLKKGNFENVMKFCYFGQFYWSLMSFKIPCTLKDSNNQTFSFSNQLLIFQMLPMCCLCMKFCYKFNVIENGDEFRAEFITKIFKLMSVSTVRIGYGWRDFLLAQTNLFEIVTKSLLYIIKSKKYYERDKAILVFQCLIYTIKDIVCIIKEKPEKMIIFEKEIYCISLMLECTAIFIQDFQITWRDSVETICVMRISFELLSIPTWPDKLVVKALKLINISIAKYMSPNMALLVDKICDSTLALVGPLIYAKLHDSSWEVRDTALEVVCTMSDISNTKFPSLQQVLLDADLPNLIIKMAIGDGESFVRATAIKCLQEMCKVEEFWERVLKNHNLPEKIAEILQTETEGTVRAEAATLMCILCENQQFSKKLINEIYETMYFSVINDLHWEVKINSLKFWDNVIKNHLNNQGMIDGAFPNVTFSKENRKIVNLTDNEIRKRLHKVLIQLNDIGCLSILITSIQDDCDLEVVKLAVKITTEFNDLLKKYNVTQFDGDCNSGSVPSSPVSSSDTGFYSSDLSPMDDYFNIDNTPNVSTIPVDNNSNNNPMPSTSTSTTTATMMEFNEEILNNIINSSDINLLSDVYISDDFNNTNNYVNRKKKIISTTPNDFLIFTTQDLNNFIKQKTNWLSGIEDLGSLLDDMLKSYDDNDVNSMDCY